MWCDGEWQAWGEPHKSTEMADVSIKAHMPFQEAKDRASKGKAKAPIGGPSGAWTWFHLSPGYGDGQF